VFGLAVHFAPGFALGILEVETYRLHLAESRTVDRYRRDCP
jgi:hypothetical protein